MDKEKKNKKISESMKGNTNALVWTKEKAEKLLLDAIILSNEKEKITNQFKREVDSYKYDFIGEIARELDTYHYNITTYIPTQYPELKHLVTKLKSNLEANCYFNTKKGIIKEATGIVNLKSNHKWTDRLDNTTGDKPIENKPDLGKASIDTLIKLKKELDSES